MQTFYDEASDRDILFLSVQETAQKNDSLYVLDVSDPVSFFLLFFKKKK